MSPVDWTNFLLFFAQKTQKFEKKLPFYDVRTQKIIIQGRTEKEKYKKMNDLILPFPNCQIKHVD